VPQDLVHSENSDHCEKFPSTVKSEIMNRTYFTGTINRYKELNKIEKLLKHDTVGSTVAAWGDIHVHVSRFF